ncbi:U3 small nucleolar RNA-associated protein 6-domain-containing protein [Dichomitus squalens]|uniref:U3 small nucleolar RNA-associated protein 6-domain-containing protein n=1 Tax=Dichomitus squalens TaxID=114155 RepID=A0A4Q9MTA4_9APHY|nr:U3 small nucleolar RNA-associated protein 6-domain-containing protein [Dichomitus squalens]
MERVQFQQEQMLTELKDLVQKGLFSQKEVKQIMQKRTAFETALVRRIPKKSDFLRYATYEMSLEALRRKRAERLKIAKGPPSVSDYALVRRQFQIFERALKKFKGDVGLWIQYIQVAKKEGARALVGRITARALQLHPNVPALYVLAASHELEHLSPTAARALLQRGLRLNSDSVEMWREYVRMELGFVESLRRRWSVLGIDMQRKGEDAGSGKGKGKERESGTDDIWSGIGDEEGEADGMDVDAEQDLTEDEVARRHIMEGAIVKSVISSAVKAIPRIDLFASLHELISTYPSPPTLRESLLDHLHGHLRETLPSLPAAIKLSATRNLTPDMVGEPLVDALKSANEQLIAAVRTAANSSDPGVANVYSEFVEEWCGQEVDDSLKAYLITSVHLLIQQLPAPVPPDLLAAHIRLLSSHQASLGSALLPPKANTPDKILRVARKHTSKAPTRSIVWLARLAAEKQFAEPKDVEQAWTEARKRVEGDGIQDVWLWGLDPENRATLRSTAATDETSPSTQHDDSEADANAELQLLEVRVTSRPPVDARLARVRRIGTAYVPSARVWSEVFSQESGGVSHAVTSGADITADGGQVYSGHVDDDARVLRSVYEYWRQRDGVGATIAWAAWLLRIGDGKEAVAVVSRARSVLGETDGETVERRWKAVLDGQDSREGGAGEEHGEDARADAGPIDSDGT